MLKTDQNLKVLEKKVRQVAALVDELRKERRAPATRQPEAREYGDLPLLQGILPEEGSSASREGWERERKEIRARIRRLMEEIEQVID